ncbi:MAG: hypothetical protein WC617_12735 [Rhodanobacter sp.]|jgi:hypothetical protein
MSFDPSKVGQRTQRPAGNTPRGPKAERVFLVVDNYETPADGFHYAVGHTVNNPSEKVRVRLNTVAERQQDNPKENEDKIKSQYLSGENHRESIGDKAKNDIRLISFDDARLVSNKDGVKEYRAHWPKTMSTNPASEVMQGLAHVRLRDAIEIGGKHQKAQAYVEMIRGAAAVTGADVQTHLLQGLAIADAEGRARDPFVILSAEYNGKVVANARVYPATTATKVFDQATGEHKDVMRKTDAETTLASLQSGEKGNNDFQNRQLDTARALIAGLTGADEPVFNSADNVVADIRNLYYGVKEGAIKVQVVSLEKIDFGAKSRQTYLKDKDRPQLAAYTIKEPAGAEQVRETSGFIPTVIAFERHTDGEPFAVFASPEAMYAKAKKFNDLKLNVVAEATHEAEAEAPAIEQEEPELVGIDDDATPF